MAVTIRTYRVRPSTDFVEEWYKVIEYFRLGRPHRFLESVWNQYLDKPNRDLSAKQIIALDRILSEFNNRKRLFKDIPAWEEYQEFTDVKYQVRSVHAPRPVKLKKLDKEELESISWLGAMVDD